MYREHTKCRACQSSDLEEVFSFGKPMALANNFTLPGEPRQGSCPVSVALCPRCGLSQLTAVVDPAILYADYKYVTSAGVTMKRHFDRLFQDILSEGVGYSCLGIGSNDGLELAFARAKGFNVFGIDPAENLCAIARNGNGVDCLATLFNVASARAAKDFLGIPGVILARHCFAHMNDWRGFVEALEVVADAKTLVCLEIPYVHDTLRRVEIDQLYHEHLSFINLHSIAALLKDGPFHIHRVCQYAIHGGSLLVMLRSNESGIQPHLSADEALAEDPVTSQHWERFSDAAHVKIAAMRKTVLDLTAKGKRVCGFGASAKASVWVSACEFTEKELLFVSDNSPLKPGRLMPGTHIPIIEQGELLSEHPDYSVIFCWNFRAEAMAALEKWRKRGGLCIIPTSNGVEIV
jgi:novobiocin biosynthesis protein NovU/D-mycarose 3-C-methyltransferase